MPYYSDKVERICFKCKHKNYNNSYRCPLCKSYSNIYIGLEEVNPGNVKKCIKCGKLNRNSKSCCHCGSRLVMISKSPNPKNDEKLYLDGIKSFISCEYGHSLSCFEKSVKLGYRKGYLALAEFYRYGYGVVADTSKVIEYINRSDLADESKKKIITEYKKEIKPEKVKISRKASPKDKKTDVKPKNRIQEEKYSDIALALPFQEHPLFKADILTKEKYAAMLNEICSTVQKASEYTFSAFDVYLKTFGISRNHLKNSMKCKMKDNVQSMLYFDMLVILSYEKNYISVKILDTISRVSGLRYDENIKKLYMFSEDSSEAWNNILNDKKYYRFSEYLELVRKNYVFKYEKMYRILITATMSAGKSSFVNALAGKKIAKTLNEACTGRIHYIYSKPFDDGMMSKWESSMSPLINANNSVITENEAEVTNSSYEAVYFKNLDSENRFVIIDTPGVNSAEHKEHSDLTKEAVLSGCYDLLIYIINYTVDSADDNVGYLQEIKESVNENIPKIFLLNKVDTFDSEDSNLSEKLRQIKKEIDDIGFRNAVLFPISANAAFFSSELNGKYDFSNAEDTIRLMSNALDLSKVSLMNLLVANDMLHLEKYYNISKNEKKIMEKRLLKAKEKNDICEAALIHSGILPLRYIINSYISERKDKT